MSARQAHVVLISTKVIAVYKKKVVEPTKPFTLEINICEQSRDIAFKQSAALASWAWLYTLKERPKIMVIVFWTSV